MSTNDTKELEDICLVSKDVVSWLWRIIAPFIIVGGLLSNLVLIIVFRYPEFLKSSTVFHFFVLAICDSLVLCSDPLGTWLVHTFNRNVKEISNFGCKLHCFVVYVSLAFSVWIVTSITAERALVVLKPFETIRMFTVRKSAVRLLIILMVLSLIYIHLFFTNGLKQTDDGMKCVYLQNEYAYFENYIFVWINLVFVFLFPFFIMAISNWFIYKAMRSHHEMPIWEDTRNDLKNVLDALPQRRSFCNDLHVHPESDDHSPTFPALQNHDSVCDANYDPNWYMPTLEEISEATERESSVPDTPSVTVIAERRVRGKLSAGKSYSEQRSMTNALQKHGSALFNADNVVTLNTKNNSNATRHSPLSFKTSETKKVKVINCDSMPSEVKSNTNRNAVSQDMNLYCSRLIPQAPPLVVRRLSTVNYNMEGPTSVSRMILLLTAVLFITMLPHSIFIMVEIFLKDNNVICNRSSATQAIFRAVTSLLMYVNNGVNIYLYAAASKALRTEILLFFGCSVQRQLRRKSTAASLAHSIQKRRSVVTIHELL